MSNLTHHNGAASHDAQAAAARSLAKLKTELRERGLLEDQIEEAAIQHSIASDIWGHAVSRGTRLIRVAVLACAASTGILLWLLTRGS